MSDATECDCCGGMWGLVDENGEHSNVWDCVTELTKQRNAARRERDALRNEWSGLLIEQARLMALRDEARVVTDAMVERASTAYRKVAAPSLRSALGVSTIRAILTAALSEAP